MRKARLLTLAAACSLIFTAGVADAQSGNRSIPMLVSAEWLQSNLDAPDLVVVQVDQRQNGYDEGHIPGARFLTYSRIAAEVDGIPTEILPVDELRAAFAEVGFVDGKRVVLYGAPLSAARAWMTLDYLGVSDRAAMLDGGIAAWRAASLPISTDAPAANVSGSLTIDLQPQRIISADDVMARKNDPRNTLIDVRPLNEYTGEDGGQNGRYLAGHIPGARHMPWDLLIYSNADPRLKPVDELRSLFEGADAVDGRSVLLYCTVGMRASMAYFVARMLDYDTYMYDGSWADWSARDNPVESGPDPRATGG